MSPACLLFLAMAGGVAIMVPVEERLSRSRPLRALWVASLFLSLLGATVEIVIERSAHIALAALWLAVFIEFGASITVIRYWALRQKVMRP